MRVSVVTNIHHDRCSITFNTLSHDVMLLKKQLDIRLEAQNELNYKEEFPL